MTPPLVIFHANCPDGFTAAWVSVRALGAGTEICSASYGEEPPIELAAGRDVYVVDFSYPRDRLLVLRQAARSLLVLDHHKTAQAALEGLPFCQFDMNRSGAGMVWDHFHPHQPRPWIVDYVEDRDLWRKRLPNNEEISLRIRVTPYTLEAWEALAAMTPDSLMPEARGAKMYMDGYVKEVLRNLYVLTKPQGADVDVACVNMTASGGSDALNEALKQTGLPMALSWHRAKDGRVNCSVRSTTPYDCSAFAKRLGGGGHAQAAGFSLEPGHPFIAELLSAV